MSRMHMSGIMAVALVTGTIAFAPRILVKVVDINGDAVPNAWITVEDASGSTLLELDANNGGVARSELESYEGGMLTFKAESPDGSMYGETETTLWKKKGTNVVRVVVDEVGGPQPVVAQISPEEGSAGAGIIVTIRAEAGSFTDSDEIFFYKDGMTVAALFSFSYSQGSEIIGLVPFSLSPGVYVVTVRPSENEPSIIQDLYFEVK